MNNSRSRKVRHSAVLAVLLAALLAPLAASALLHHGPSRTAAGMPRPDVVAGPPRRTTMRTAVFVLGDEARGARFRCSLDGAPFEQCSRTLRYGLHGTPTRCGMHPTTSAEDQSRPCADATDLVGLRVRNGGHVLRVMAIGVRGRRSQAIAYHWTILPEISLTLAIASSPLPPDLYPGGPALPIPLVIGNPSNRSLFVQRLVVTASTGSASCPASRNLQITPSNVSRRRPIRIAPRSQVTLPADGVTAPSVRLLELPVNQDGCKGASIRLHYAGAGRA